MKSKLSLIAIAIIGLMFLSMPAKAQSDLSFHKSNTVVILCSGAYTYDTSLYESDEILNGQVGACAPSFAMVWATDPVNGYNTPPFNRDSWIDLGQTMNISGFNVHAFGSLGLATLSLYSSTTSNTTDFTLAGSESGGAAIGWFNTTFTARQARYIRWSRDVASGSLQIDEFQIVGNPAPNITGWSNSYTNNNSLTLSPPTTTNVIFSVTSVDQPVNYYNWSVDGVDQNTNFSSISRSFSPTAHTVSATVTNYNGTSSPVTWTVNGAAYQIPSAPAIPSGSQCAVMFDKSTQQINSIGYVLTNTEYSFLDFNSYRTEVYSTKIPLLYSFQMDKSNATEIFTISYPLPDVYTAQVVKSVPLLGDSIICTNTTQATMGANSLFVPAIVSVGTQNNISFILGYTPNHTTDTINIRVFDSDGNLESIYGVSDANTTTGVQYYQNVRYLREGTYTTKLTSSFFGVLDSKASQAVLTPNNPTRNILPPSFINVSQPFYAFGDTIEYGYQIDDANYSNYSQYIAVYNWNQSVTTRVISLCGKQWNWLVHLPIVNGLVINENCDTYDLQNDGFLSGLNKLSLRGQNSTADIELAYVNFTIASTDSDGWGMSVDKNKICTGDTIRLKVIVPGTSAGYLKYGISGSLTTLSVNKTATFPFTPNEAGDFIFELYDGGNTLRKIENVKVSDCVTATPPPTQSEQTTTRVVDGWVGLMGLGVNAITKFLFAWFWITIFMAIGLARSEGKPLMGTIFGLFPFGFFVFIAYLPVWFVIVVILEVLVATRVFR